ncbi:peptidase inhibitor family I36 protein [Dactylosporangium sp. NBC_01737]|uniref:peptidase inhibitor family I36 protein n=1 Tax=Dactylosporangium sp. NBC_01737 TaxID=2975959 RepID=UPI002E0D54EB|nr:peptidase inhibitor family I36 protein [Dactylosporangium sp. NBC_01737]
MPHHAIRILRTAAIIALAGAALATTSTPAVAAPGDGPNQHLVDAYLAEHPGGVQTGPSDISYSGGKFVVTVARPAASLAGADCPSGWFCFYDKINFGYPRGRLSDCSWQDLGSWGWRNRTESVAYNLGSGYVTFFDTDSTYSALFAVGASSSGKARSIADVGGSRNRADEVYRTNCGP